MNLSGDPKRKRSRRAAAALALALTAGAAAVCPSKTLFPFSAVPAAREAFPLSRTGFFFDTIVTVTIYGMEDVSGEDTARTGPPSGSAADLMDRCFGRMEELDALLSRTDPASDIWKINHGRGQPVEVSQETADLIGRALAFSDLTGGRFDITIAPVVSLWDFTQTGDDPVLPSEAEIAQALTHVGSGGVLVENDTVTLTDPEASVDLGGIAKGYISDVLRDLLSEGGVSGALINLGGNVMTVGSKEDGSLWRIGIREPFSANTSDLAAVADIADGCVITSGSYERCFTKDGVLYHHILDPSTGYPARTGLTGVSIYCEDGTAGDALSTACFLLGPEEGMELIEGLEDTEALFLLEDGSRLETSGWPG